MKIQHLLRIEGLIVLVLAAYAYQRTGVSWLLFAALILLPDLSAAGYLLGPKKGAMLYNVAHTYLIPALLAVFSWNWDYEIGIAIALIWVAHIGLDRALGFGLKKDGGFKQTHLDF